MRKSLLVLFFLMIGIGMMSSQSITVTSPHAGDTWYKTNSYTITWTKTGDQHARVKIRLYDPTGTDKILNIVDDTANDGSFPWAIPGSVAAGRYVVRVKTLDNEVYDDSEVFEIKAPTFRRRPQPPVRLAQDLEIRDIYYKGGWIVARVKSNVNHFKGRVKFGIVLNTLSNSITKKLDIAKGRTADVYVKFYRWIGSQKEGVTTRINVDSDNSISEHNENNNTMEKTIPVYDIRFEGNLSNSFSLKRVLLRGGKDYKLEFDFKVRHNFKGDLDDIKIKIEVKGDYDDNFRRRNEWYVHARISQGHLYSKHLELFFEKGSRIVASGRNMLRPPLSEGHRYRLMVTIDPDNKFFETNERNNSASFTFTVNK